MPSPFPGMDPYLESPDWFPDLHHGLIYLIKESLQHSLPESYSAQSDQRIWMEYSLRHIEPDVEVVRSTRKRRKQGRGGVAVAEPRAAGPLVVSVETIEDGPFEEAFIEIRRRRGKEVQLVASLEILSLSNKRIGNPGRAKYLAKQREVLDSPVHLIEIDLLRSGTYTVAVPSDLIKAKAGPFDYLVSIRRFDRPKEFLVYPISLPQRLPEIAIPLLPGDPEVPLDLQAIFDRAYDGGPYGREIEYGKDPIRPRLSSEQAEWAAAVLKPRGRRA
jgi:hypothetical protein